jgi:hypothetical protein
MIITIKYYYLFINPLINKNNIELKLRGITDVLFVIFIKKKYI